MAIRVKRPSRSIGRQGSQIVVTAQDLKIKKPPRRKGK